MTRFLKIHVVKVKNLLGSCPKCSAGHVMSKKGVDSRGQFAPLHPQSETHDGLAANQHADCVCVYA